MRNASRSICCRRNVGKQAAQRSHLKSGLQAALLNRRVVRLGSDFRLAATDQTQTRQGDPHERY